MTRTPPAVRRAIVFPLRMLRFLASAAALAAMLAGLPGALVRFVGWPLPHGMPSLDQVRTTLDRPLTGTMVQDLVACVVWLLWAAFLAAVLTETVYLGRGLHAPRIRVLSPVQAVAALLVAGLSISPAASAVITSMPRVPAPSPHVAAATLVRAGPSDALTRAVPATSTAAKQPGAVAPESDGSRLVRVGDQHYTYPVARGDTLWHIAGTWLGNPLRWPEIYHLNQAHYDQHGGMHGGDHIEPGWVLVLPEDATPPATAAPAPPRAPTPPDAPSPAPPTVASPSPGVSVPPSASPIPSTPYLPGDLLSTPAASGAGTGVASPARSATQASTSPRAEVPLSPSASGDTPTSPQDGQHRRSNDGIDVPGGWLTTGLGAALLLAVATVWRRRRHRYVPTPVTTAILDDPDLVSPLSARTLIRQKLRRAAPTADLDEPALDTGPTVREYVEAERTGVEVRPVLPEVGPTGPETAGLGFAPLTGGLGLDGDGALDAARALLIATLSAGHSGDPDARGRTVIPAATLASLIGVTAIDLGAWDRLIIADTFADAVVYVEEEIIRRSRTTADAQVADVVVLRNENAFAEPLPQLLLIADAPEPAWRDRIATALGLGERVDIAAVFVGRWSTTLTVAADGTTVGGDGDTRRVAVLDADSTAEAIAMLREAHTDDDAPRTPSPAHASHRRTRTSTDGPHDWEPAASDADDINAPTDRTGRGEPATAAPIAREPSTPVVQVRILGQPAVLDATGLPAPKLRAKSRELLVYLAVNRNGAKLTDIMEAIWPDAIVRRAEQRLSTCVANLRGVIRAVATHSPTDPDPDPDPDPDTGTDAADDEQAPKLEPVVNTGGFYRLDPAIVAVDWWTMLDEYAQVAAGTDDPRRLAHLLAAIAAGRGPLADGTDYDWIDTDRERVRRHQIKLLAHAAELLADSDPHASRALLDDACTLDPLSDDLARRAMRAAAAIGDADGIRYRLDTLRRALDDADLDLDADTEQYAATLLRDLDRHRPDT